MTIPEAVELVIQAGAMAKGGDVFVLDMGEPVSIIELAHNLIHLCGLTVREGENPNGDIAIEFSGLRPGEKLYEELLVGDNVVGTVHPMIMRAEEQMIHWKHLSSVVNNLEKACREFDYEKVRSLLLETVDGYSPQCEIIDPIWKSVERKIYKEAPKSPIKLLFKKK